MNYINGFAMYEDIIASKSNISASGLKVSNF